MDEPKNEQQPSNTKPKREPKPRKPRSTAARKHSADIRKKKTFIAKIAVCVGAAWPVVQVIFGAWTGHWKDPWFIVTFLLAIWVAMAFLCWWYSLKWLKSSAVLVVSLALLCWGGKYWHSLIPVLDLLMPANDPMPPFPRGLQLTNFPPNSTFFFLGGSVVAMPNLPSGLIPLVRSDGVTLLSIAVTKSGAAISGQFFDETGKVIAILEGNRPIVNTHNSFNPKRPDRSTFIVSDPKGNIEVLNIRYLNRSAFKLSGRLRSLDGTEISITDSNITGHFSLVKNLVIANEVYIGRGLLKFSDKGMIEVGIR